MSAATEHQAPDQKKREATARAVAALAGCELERLDDGTYVVSKWNLTKPLPDLDAVESWLNRLAGRS